MSIDRNPLYLFLLYAAVFALIGCAPIAESSPIPSPEAQLGRSETHSPVQGDGLTAIPTTIAPPTPVISDVRQITGMQFVINQPDAAEHIFLALNQLHFVTRPYSATLHISGPIQDSQDYFLQIKAATENHYWLTDSFENQCLYFDETMYRGTQGSWGKASLEEGRSCFRPADYVLLTLLSTNQRTQMNASCANPSEWQGKFIRQCRVEVVAEQGEALTQITFWLDAESDAPWQIINQPNRNLSQDSLLGSGVPSPYTITVDYAAQFELEAPQ